MRVRAFLIIVLITLLSILPGTARAQSLSFSLDEETINLFWNDDGTLSIDYIFKFTNDGYASPIDYIDVGIPNESYDINSIYADVNGHPITDITVSPYVDIGVALGLGQNAIQPGETGIVHVFIGTVRNVLYKDDQDKNYASAVFIPNYFDSSFVHGNTNITITLHLPPGVQPEEPRWHAAPSGWQSQPETGFDENGRIIYTWNNQFANGYSSYKFGASFPKTYIPAGAIVRPSPFAWLKNINLDCLIPFLCLASVIGFIVWTVVAGKKRTLQYFPPKITIEGHGIKRGLTAVEAGIIMEQPLDKVLTMILFGLIKKNAAQVTTRDPLVIEKLEPQPTDLHAYEKEFLVAMCDEKGSSQRRSLQNMMIELVKSVGQKMKGFSRKETISYYKDIMERAWKQVEDADTPEVKSLVYDQVMEWTMLDRDYDDRTRDVFRHNPIFIPTWWHRYDPVYRKGVATAPTVPTATQGPGPSISLPHLPGSDFAASVVKGVQSFSGNIIGNITDFTGKVTNATNPVPQTSSTSSRSSTGRSGSGCACACACAGCACACAGGGR